MTARMRVGPRVVAALVVTAVPVSLAGLSPLITPTASSTAAPLASAAVTTVPVTSLQRHDPGELTGGYVLQAVTEQTTISAGLSLKTKAERNRRIAVSSAKGSHVWTASSLAEHDLPSAAMRAYQHAASLIDSTDPGCHLPWTLLAGIGRVESDHGRYGGSVLGNDGVPRPAIVGIPLNGKGPVAAIHDTDHGVFDGDTVWDRAVGPMQFIPSTWRSAGRDGDGNGVKSPNDIDDASLAAAAYLCNGGGNLSDSSAAESAVFRYNPSDYYVALVTAFAHGYKTGVFVIPSPDPAPGAGDGVVHLNAAKAHAKAKAKARAAAARAKARAARARARASARAARLARARSHAAPPPARHVTHPVRHRPTGTHTTTGTGGSTPTPPPAPPKLVLSPVTGVLAGSGSDWTLDGKALDFGAGRMGDKAARDYDGQNGVQTLGQELAGLATGAPVTLQVKSGTMVVYLIAGLDYRGADGSFTAPTA